MTDNRTTELLPCPFCGGEAFVRIDISLRPTQSRYRVGCDKDSSCHGWYGHSRYYATEAEAIAAWNTRHVEMCSGELDYNSWFFCSNCGCQTKADQYGVKPNYCASCGCKVVES